MRLLAPLFVLALLSSAAHAALPPQAYQQARQNADSVVVVEVEKVREPPAPDGHGDCSVSGQVAAIERGARYSVGQDMEIAVPCRRDGAAIPIGGVQWQNVDALHASRWGRAWLPADGTLALYQYEILPSYP